ncbi:uncharacterized protein C24H6.02c isoform X1 [Amaranthus tricolor]|uniref:uncharacterized protein C24H6.02c isoform X1 n=1 Tax=Amaranthus tricolor TaxID=29722 RepID=UPI00258F6729|nr:uncharacterized protein C24H6.02c isoform X1 [Amaranthus tricolor]
MRKALTNSVSWWRLLRHPPISSLSSPCSSYRSLPTTATILEKYLNFSRGIQTHSHSSYQETKPTETAAECCSESTADKTLTPSNLQADVQTADSSKMSNLKISERHNLAIVFTCKVCEQRSMKTCSRESYEKGVVVVRCGGCNNLHLIADRLGWFGEPGSIEDFIAARGDLLKKGSIDTLNLTLEDLAGKKLLEDITT